jgi:hypothetical protein
MLYTIEYDITNIDEKLIENIKQIANDCSFDCQYHGKDRVVLTNDRGMRFTEMINRISRICDIYGVDYFSLLGNSEDL